MQRYFNFSKIVKENNLDEFEKLDDTIFRQILNSKDKKLDASREILKRVTDRRLYKFLGSCVLPENLKLDKKQLEIEVNSFPQFSKIYSKIKFKKNYISLKNF